MEGLEVVCAADAGDLRQLLAAGRVLLFLGALHGELGIALGQMDHAVERDEHRAVELQLFLVRLVLQRLLVDLVIDVGLDAADALLEQHTVIGGMMAPGGLGVEAAEGRFLDLFREGIFREFLAEADGCHRRDADDQLIRLDLDRHVLADERGRDSLADHQGFFFDLFVGENGLIHAPPFFLGVIFNFKQSFLDSFRTGHKWFLHFPLPLSGAGFKMKI